MHAAHPDLVRLVSVPAGDAAAAWARGRAEARGDYVQFLTAADQIGPDKLEAQLVTAAETGAVVAAGAYHDGGSGLGEDAAGRANFSSHSLDIMPTMFDHLKHYRSRYQSMIDLVDAQQKHVFERVSRPKAWVRMMHILVAPRKTILFYPNRPGRWAVAYKLSSRAGYWITTNPKRKCDAAFRWEVATRATPQAFRYEAGAINCYCTDISKQHVEKVFAEVFGYDLGIDPTVYKGLVVKKSDENATHDGEVITCPIPAQDVVPGFVYQKFVDNRRQDAEGFYEYRVPIFMKTIPAVYVKYRPTDAQFKEFDGAEVVSPQSVLSEEEQRRLLAFSEALQFEYGELDVLRDRGDGRIYVVDANNTPSGPTRGFRPEQRVEALEALQPAFEALLAESARRLAQAPGHHPSPGVPAIPSHSP